jgi:hypothetical protein
MLLQSDWSASQVVEVASLRQRGYAEMEMQSSKKCVVHKGVSPATGSPTATLLRLHISYNTCSKTEVKKRTHPCEHLIFLCSRSFVRPSHSLLFVQIPLPLCDGRCVQGSDTNSP